MVGSAGSEIGEVVPHRNRKHCTAVMDPVISHVVSWAYCSHWMTLGRPTMLYTRGVQPVARGKVLSGPRGIFQMTYTINLIAYVIYGELTFREIGIYCLLSLSITL